MAAFGGVAVNRSDRDKAIRVLNYVLFSSTRSKSHDCVLIAPEGTRSVSGQLMEFKKGPFYIWEGGKIDVIPIVVFGAFELFPKGQAMNSAGRVVVHILPPIPAHCASSRTEMSALVRDSMLQALAKNLDALSDPQLSLAFLRLRAYGVCAFVLAIDILLLHLLYNHFSPWKIVTTFVLLTILVTLLIYFYYVHVLVWLSPPRKTGKE